MFYIFLHLLYFICYIIIFIIYILFLTRTTMLLINSRAPIKKYSKLKREIAVMYKIDGCIFPSSY